MEITKEMLFLKSVVEQDVNIFEVLLYGAFLVIILLYIVIRIYVDHKNFKNPNVKKRFWLGYWAFIVFVIVVNVISGFVENDIYNKRIELEQAYMQDLKKDAVIEVDKVISNEVVQDKMCRMLNPNDNQVCTLLELIADSEYYQIIIPLTIKEQKNISEGMKVTYLLLEDDNRQFLKKYLSRGSVRYPITQEDFTGLIRHDDNWSFGTSIN